MLPNLIFVACILSGSVGCAAVFNKRCEEILPITCMSFVLILFLFGILGHLKVGFYTILLIACIIYLLTVIYLVKSKNIKSFLENSITPGMLVFLVLFVCLNILNYGKMASIWDEFSHWFDIVKVMTTIDDFGTNPISHSMFQSYPPGMSLFQYFLQKCYLLCHPDKLFNEWRCYLSYQLFFFVIFMRFFNCSFKKPLGILVVFSVIFLGPLVFFSNIYKSTYVDPFVGALAGAGFAAIITEKKKDIVYSIYLFLLCSTLVLAKDVGLLFAIFLAAAYVADMALRNRKDRKWRQLIQHTFGIISAIILPKLLWNYEVNVSQAVKNFHQKIDFSIVLNVFLGKDDSYRKNVLESYRNMLRDASVPLGNTGISLNYICLFFTLIAISFIVYYGIKSRQTMKAHSVLFVFFIEYFLLVFYIFGLCILYMFRFTEYEALNLASSSRYLGIAFLCVWLTNLLVISDFLLTYFHESKGRQLLVLYAVLLLIPGAPVLNFVTGRDTETSKAVRVQYEPLTEKIMNVSKGGSTFYYISQEDNGFDYWVTRYNVRPNFFWNSSYNNWSLGGPFYDGDIWSTNKSPEEWWNELQANCDYVAIHRLNDYFLETYGCLFQSPDEISADSVYVVDKELGFLRKVE